MSSGRGEGSYPTFCAPPCDPLGMRGVNGDCELDLARGQPMGVGWVAPIELRVPGLFEEMVGELRLDPIDDVTTRVTLRVSYASASEPRDDTHRLVETLVKRFIDSLVAVTLEPDGHSTTAQ